MAAGKRDKGTKTPAGQMQEKISRDDLEGSLRSIVGEAEKKAQSSARRLIPVVAGGGLLVLFLVYVLGKRVGTTKSTVVEIRRI